MPNAPKLMRDAVIETIFEAARKDRDIFFISADFGAKALDDFRAELPDQFIHAGISEQNMVDLASGLALSGKKVFLYAMAPFMTARCYEQIKCVLASMQLPVTMIAVGVGLGYDHATLTHFTPEDIASMRAMNGIEIITPSDEASARLAARIAIDEPAFRYLRLERQPQMPLYNGDVGDLASNGIGHVRKGKDVGIVASGYLTHKALAAAEKLKAEHGVEAGVIDIFRTKPISAEVLASATNDYDRLVTVDEQLLDGGMGTAVLETLMDAGAIKPVTRLGIKDGFEVVNGSRDELHALYGIDTDDIVRASL